MKASEVIELLGISRPLLSYYKKMNYIRAEKVRGQYDYNEEDVLNIKNGTIKIETTKSNEQDQINISVNNEDLKQACVLMKESLDIIKDFFYWMNKINFMSTEYGKSLEDKIKELDETLSKMS